MSDKDGITLKLSKELLDKIKERVVARQPLRFPDAKRQSIYHKVVVEALIHYIKSSDDEKETLLVKIGQENKVILENLATEKSLTVFQYVVEKILPKERFITLVKESKD